MENTIRLLHLQTTPSLQNPLLLRQYTSGIYFQDTGETNITADLSKIVQVGDGSFCGTYEKDIFYMVYHCYIL